LDALTEAIPEARAVMKIDVEGTEAVILQQGARFLSTNHPDILREVLHGVGGPFGYRYYLVEESGVRRSDRIVPSTRFRDWLFTTRTVEDLDVLGIGVSS
jgi:hypothetical protein